MKRNGRDRIGEEKGLTHVSLLLELFKVRKDTFPNRKCRVLKTANRSCSPPLGRSLGHIGDTRHQDAIIAQNTAKRNLDFGKRAQKSAELSGGVVRL